MFVQIEFTWKMIGIMIASVYFTGFYTFRYESLYYELLP